MATETFTIEVTVVTPPAGGSARKIVCEGAKRIVDALGFDGGFSGELSVFDKDGDELDGWVVEGSRQ